MNEEVSPYILVGAFTMIGLGVGFMLHNMLPWLLIGIGTGLLMSFLFSTFRKKK